MVGQHKCKLGVHGYKQEDDERIRERYQERRPRVVPEGALLFSTLVHLLRGVGVVSVPSEAQQQYATTYLQIEPVLVVSDKVHYKRHTETGYRSIYDVACRSTQSCGKTEPSSLVQCSLYAENANWPHWSAGNHTDQHPFEDEV